MQNDVSVIIPCHYKHYYFLDKLLGYYNIQTLIPKEVIIVLSESEKISENDINKLDKNYNFQLIIIKIKGISNAGNSRYIGTNESNSSIIVFQDADDLPHIQRLECINYYFNKYPNINHICHAYSRKTIFSKYNVNNVPIEIINYNIFNDANKMERYKLTNGNIAIRKEIISNIEWIKNKQRGQDVALNKNIFKVYNKFLMIKVPLYIYRQEYTTKFLVKK